MAEPNSPFKSFAHVGLALDPIHVGTGGSRLGRVDSTIVRDPVTRVPKIPGSSLAGVLRAYAAMVKSKYPDCAGQGQPDKNDEGGHCGKPDCPICTVFGFARGSGGGFAGLAAFSDAHVLLFPVATREGPVWITSPGVLRSIESLRDLPDVTEDAILRAGSASQHLNLGWIVLPSKTMNGKFGQVANQLKTLGVPDHVLGKWALVSDKLFSHIVNSNLEVRTSVSIDPETGAAKDGALFTYEALSRGTVLLWQVTCRDPKHFKVGTASVTAVTDAGSVHAVVEAAHAYIEHLGIGGMGTRGMGRLRVLKALNDRGGA